MKEQDIIKIRNKAGILDVKLIKQLDSKMLQEGFVKNWNLMVVIDLNFIGKIVMK